MVRLGQHFLVHRGLAQRMVSLCEPGAPLVEIGPGRGALTEHLLRRAGRLLAIEVDPGLIELLRRRFGPGLELMEADARFVDWRALARRLGGPLGVVGNLPFHAATAILQRLLEQRDAVAFMVLSFQREVASRIVACPGERSYGSLSVLCQLYAAVRWEMTIPRWAFCPVPRVDAAVLRFLPLARPRVPVEDEEGFQRVVRGVFRHRRKALRNALRLALGLSPERVERLLGRAGIHPLRRPETLSLEEFGRLVREMRPCLGQGR